MCKFLLRLGGGAIFSGFKRVGVAVEVLVFIYVLEGWDFRVTFCFVLFLRESVTNTSGFLKTQNICY